MSTVEDVARRAGVAASTVSRYLNGRLRTKPETQQRIREAIAALDYVPHAVARNLATGESRAIGLVIPGVANPYFAVTAEEIEALASAQGYSLLLCNTKGLADREADYIALLSRSRIVDGLIYAGVHPRNKQLAATISNGLPVVVVDELIAGLPPVSTVVMDNYGGAFAATQHLVQLGHRRVALITGSQDLVSARDRAAGYQAALEIADISPDPDLMCFNSYTEASGREALAKLLTLPSLPTAVFAAADTIALGVYGAALDHGLSLPEDLSVVGFDDIPMSRYLAPPLTTVRMTHDVPGHTAFTILLRHLKDRGARPEHMVLPVELVLRSSTGPVPARLPVQAVTTSGT